LTKKKNLSEEDLQAINLYEETLAKKQNSNKFNLSEISIQVKCLNEKQKELKKAIEEKDVVICVGSAGTGKTFMSLLTALHLLKTESTFTKLILIKSLQVIKGEDIGLLPGTVYDKITPYMYSYTSNLDKIFGNSYVTKSFIDQGIIEMFPIAFCRGITFSKNICIIDEIQNLTVHSFKTLITRIGENSKMIFLGDDEQSDLKNPEESCIKKITKALSNNKHVKIIEFTDNETVRNPIIKDIIRDLKCI